MFNRLVLFALGSCIFLFFVVFSYLVHKNVFTQVDFNTTVRLQDNLSRRFDQPFSLFSEVGAFEVMLILLIIILVLRRSLWGVVAFGLFGVFHLIEIYGKTFVQQLPPPHFMLRTEHLVDFPQFHVRSEFSYPSGHAGRAAFLTVLIGILVWRSPKLSKAQKIFIISLLAMYDIAMFISRIYLGEHWATDVIGGALLGVAMAAISSAAL